MTALDVIPGVGPTIAKVLISNNIPCAEVLAFMEPNELWRRVWRNTKISEDTCSKIIRNARNILGLSEVREGREIDNEWKHRKVLTTGVEPLDEQLLGGIDTGSLVEMFGAARGGKSQWCHQLAVNGQLPKERGGLETNVLWLDTEGSCNTLVIRAMAIRMGLEPEDVLSRIHVFNIIGRDQLLDTMKTLPDLVHSLDARIIIIDSLGMFFRQDVEEIEFHTVYGKELAQIFHILRGLARTLGCIVIYTNQVYNKISSYGGNLNEATGGHLMAHASTYKFYVRRRKESQRSIALQDHVGLPEFSIDVEIDWGGFYGTVSERKAVGPVIKDYLNTLPEFSAPLTREEVSESGSG